MERRRFLLGWLAGLLAPPLAAEAQLAGKVYRVGWLAPAPIPENMHAFRKGLRALGYVEGNNVVIEQRSPRAKSHSAPLQLRSSELIPMSS
jgi:putative ABC transport system substrate-binding protein